MEDGAPSSKLPYRMDRPFQIRPMGNLRIEEICPKTQILSKKTQAESRALALILRTHIFEKTSKNYEKIPFHIHGSVRAHFIIDLVH
ncbi:MAG: hypothetical protein KBS80_02890, partial [Bacteroidales bacterium]|nr:hypothetical protein [Candidatus Cryptobacteroides choladohippi]